MAAIGPDDPIPASTVVALRLREIRTQRGMNSRQLVARCAELGTPGLTPAMITNIEAGRRQINVDELLVFALALDVPPITLLAPSRDRPLTVAPSGDTVVSDRAAFVSWLSGEHALPGFNADRYEAYAAYELPERVRSSQDVGSRAWQASAARLLQQFSAELDDVTGRLREEFSTALAQIAAAVERDETGEDVVEEIQAARERLERARRPRQP